MRKEMVSKRERRRKATRAGEEEGRRRLTAEGEGINEIKSNSRGRWDRRIMSIRASAAMKGMKTRKMGRNRKAWRGGRQLGGGTTSSAAK